MRPGALAALLSFQILAAEEFMPARLSDGPVPLPPPQTVGWSEVFLEVSVSAAGSVRAIETLNATEPLSTLVRAAIAGWIFLPATQAGRRVESRVLVAAVYRPATLFNTPGLDKRPQDLAAASDQIPLPTVAPPPSYPPRALGDGVVLVEVLVAHDGIVRAATVVRSSTTAFNASAVRSATGWRFRPARRGGVSVPAFIYLVFGFRQPVVSR